MKKSFSSILFIFILTFSISITGCGSSGSSSDSDSDTKSSNANLSSLAISAGTLNPIFSENTLSYTAVVDNSTSSITITPVTADAGATIEVNDSAVTSNTASDAITLTVGENTIEVVVTAEDGTTTKTYTVVVTRLSSSTTTPLTAADLTGSWGDTEFVFEFKGDDGTAGTDDDIWTKTYFTVSGSTIILTMECAFGADADSLTTYSKFENTFSFTLGSLVTTPAGATEIDMTQTSCTYTFLDADYVSAANDDSIYGYTDWVINVAKDVSGKAFLAGEDAEDPNGTIWYSVVKISAGVLYLGDDEADVNYDGSTAAKRPQVLDSGWASLDAK